jgi:hypothetical protein
MRRRVDFVPQRLGIETERRGDVELDRRFGCRGAADHRVRAARRLFRAERASAGAASVAAIPMMSSTIVSSHNVKPVRRCSRAFRAFVGVDIT